jgi:hypothetical protein
VAGELDKRRDLRALARYLTCSLQGLLVIGKVRTNRSALEDVVEVTLQALSPGNQYTGKVDRSDKSSSGLLSDGMAGKSNVSKLFTAGERAARMRRSTMRLSRSMSFEDEINKLNAKLQTLKTD